MKFRPRMSGWADFKDIYREIYERNADLIADHQKQAAEWKVLDSLNNDLMWAENRVQRAMKALEEVLDTEHAWDDTLMPLSPVKDALRARAKALDAKYRANEEVLDLTREK